MSMGHAASSARSVAKPSRRTRRAVSSATCTSGGWPRPTRLTLAAHTEWRCCLLAWQLQGWAALQAVASSKAALWNTAPFMVSTPVDAQTQI